MAVKGGPNIKTSGLNIVLDSGNKKSIPVDPTVNLVPNPNNINLWGYPVGNVSVTSSNVIAPDGTLTANTVNFVTGSGYFAYITPIGATTGSQYTTSVYVKMLSGLTIVWSWGGVHGGNRTNFTFDPTTGTFSNVSVAPGEIYGAETSSNGYWRLYASSTMNAGTALNYYPQLTVGVGNSFAVWGTQIERNSYATPLVTGARTAWINIANLQQTANLLSGSVTSSIPQFTSLGSGLLSFDGTGSFSTITSSWSYLSSSAIETVFNLNTLSGSGYIALGGYDQLNTDWFGASVAGMLFLTTSDKKINASVITLVQGYRSVVSTTVMNTGSYYHVVFNKDTTAGTLQLYVNGVLEATNTFDTGSYAQWYSTGSLQGSNIIKISNTNSGNPGWNPKFTNAKIPIFKLYTQTLTAGEVKQNYNAIKSRFGLG